MTNCEDVGARRYLYSDFPQYFVWNRSARKWTRRQRTNKPVASRMFNISLTHGELYYLRLLLLHVRGATSYDDLKTVNGTVCLTFEDACRERNLLAEDREWFRCLEEACQRDMPNKLRQMFAYILIFGVVSDACRLWSRFRSFLSEDFVRRQHMDENAVEVAALVRIQRTLSVHGRRLLDFGIQVDIGQLQVSANDGDDDVDQQHDFGNMLGHLNADQRSVFDVVVGASEDARQERRFFFLKGAAGTGKTYLYNAIINRLDADGGNVIAVA